MPDVEDLFVFQFVYFVFFAHFRPFQVQQADRY
jgi:hypothetical protein